MNTHSTLHVLDAQTVRRAKNTVSQKQIWHYRLWVAVRFAVALIGGYALSALSTIILSRLFIEDPVNAVMSATLLSFLLHVGAFIWVFMVQQHLKACLGILVPVAVLYGIHLVMGA